MEKFIINGTTFTDFGTNNYSDGMHLVTAESTEIVQDVLDGKYPGIYLNPSAPCDSAFYGVFGTSEQYSEFYRKQRESQMASQILGKVNADWSNYREVRAEVEANYKDWWEK